MIDMEESVKFCWHIYELKTSVRATYQYEAKIMSPFEKPFLWAGRLGLAVYLTAKTKSTQKIGFPTYFSYWSKINMFHFLTGHGARHCQTLKKTQK